MRFGKRDATEVMIPNEMPPEHRKALREAGIVFGRLDEESPVFVHVRLPKGWRYAAPHREHRGWASIFDARGGKRAITHCCVDGKPYMTLALPRYTYDIRDTPARAQVLDRGQKNAVVFTTQSYDDVEQAREGAKDWLKAHYPSWEDASAYWG